MGLWKFIPGYEWLYAINSKGQIERFDKDKLMAINYSTTYPTVQFCKNNKKNIFQVHRLLAIAFIANPDNKPQVNHKNGNKQDFALENLEWVTGSENCKHAYDTGLARVSARCREVVSMTHSGANHYNHKKVIDISTNTIYDTIRAAAKANNIPVQTLHRHLHQENNKTQLRFFNI